MPGRLVDVGGWQLHLNCEGASKPGEPTVVLEAGGGDFSVTWALVQPMVATFARVCSYDRSGSGWSDLGPNPRTMRQMVYELHALLNRAGVSPLWCCGLLSVVSRAALRAAVRPMCRDSFSCASRAWWAQREDDRWWEKPGQAVRPNHRDQCASWIFQMRSVNGRNVRRHSATVSMLRHLTSCRLLHNRLEPGSAPHSSASAGRSGSGAKCGYSWGARGWYRWDSPLLFYLSPPKTKVPGDVVSQWQAGGRRGKRSPSSNRSARTCGSGHSRRGGCGKDAVACAAHAGVVRALSLKP